MRMPNRPLRRAGSASIASNPRITDWLSRERAEALRSFRGLASSHSVTLCGGRGDEIGHPGLSLPGRLRRAPRQPSRLGQRSSKPSRVSRLRPPSRRRACRPVLRGKSICVTGEVFEMPALAERSLSLAISGAEVCSESAKHKAGGPKMHRGPFVPFGS